MMDWMTFLEMLLLWSLQVPRQRSYYGMSTVCALVDAISASCHP